MTAPRTRVATKASGTEQFSALLNLIYDTALDPSLWEAALEVSCRYLDCQAGGIASFDILRTGMNFQKWWGYKQPYLEQLARYWLKDPLSQAIALL